jgi:hypothetical protein
MIKYNKKINNSNNLNLVGVYVFETRITYCSTYKCLFI